MALALIIQRANVLCGSRIFKVSTNALSKSTKFTQASLLTSNSHRSHFVNNLSVQVSTKLIERNISTTQMLKSAHGDHSKMWLAEKGLSALLLLVIPTAFLIPSALMDNVLAVTIALHSHWGVESIIVDYMRPIVFGTVIPKVAIAGCYLLSFFIFGSLLYLNYNDVGLTKAIRTFWNLQPSTK